MDPLTLTLGVFLLPCISTIAQSDGCTNVQTVGLEVINMCERRSWTLGRVFISVTTDSMGSNTRCVCVIRSRTTGLDTTTTVHLREADSNISRCQQSLIQVDPFSKLTGSELHTFTCTSPLQSLSFTGTTSDDVTITLTRPDTSVAVSYCLLIYPGRHQADDLKMTCQSGATSLSSSSSITSSSAVPTATLSTISITRNPYSTTYITSFVNSTTPTTSTPSSITPTTSTPSSTTPTTSTPSSTTPTTSTPLSTSPPASNPLSSTTSLMTAANRVDTSTGISRPATNGSEVAAGQGVSAGAVAGMAVGAIALVCLAVIVSVYMFIRCRTKTPSSPESGADNSAYTSLSDLTRYFPPADPDYAVILSERSRPQPAGSDKTDMPNAYEVVV